MQRPLAFDATREVIDLFLVAFPFWPRGRPSGAWRPHRVSPFPPEAATGCACSAVSMPLPQLYTVRVTTKSLRYSVRSVGPESLCPGCRIFRYDSMLYWNPTTCAATRIRPTSMARTQIESVFFFFESCGEGCHRCSEGNSRSQQRLLGPSRAARPWIRTNLLRIKKARLSTRLGSGAETADHFTRLFFSRLRPCKSPWWKHREPWALAKINRS
jgi:hypothetical protein